VHRAVGLTARRSELDGFNGAMARLRGTYDALNMAPPAATPPDMLVEAMQFGDRMGYHPENAQKEIAHFHQLLPQAQDAVSKRVQEARQRMDVSIQSLHRPGTDSVDLQAEKQKRANALDRAEKLVSEAGK
jgi:hypothetical protein